MLRLICRADLLHRKGLPFLIPVFQKVGDGPFQFGHGIKTTASDSLLADDAEPALDQVQPRRAGWGEVQMKFGMLAEPLCDRRMFTGAVIVTDQVQFAAAIAAGK